jgi:hypothetical protein
MLVLSSLRSEIRRANTARSGLIVVMTKEHKRRHDGWESHLLRERKKLPTVIDESALDHETVFCSAGKRGLEIELAPADLVRLTSARTAPIGRA